MNKKEVRNWINDEKEGKLRKLKEVSTKLKSEYMDNYIEKNFGSELEALTPILDEAESKLKAIIDKTDCNAYRYSNIHNALSQNRYNLTTIIKGTINWSGHPQYSEIERRSIAQAEEIDQFYRNLEGNIDNMTGKQATKYLEELGLPLPDKEKVTALVKPIDLSLVHKFYGNK